MLSICLGCGAAYALGLPACPHCGSAESRPNHPEPATGGFISPENSALAVELTDSPLPPADTPGRASMPPASVPASSEPGDKPGPPPKGGA